MEVADTTQRELSYRKRLVEIANIINSAPGIPDILVDLKDKMLDLVDAERVTIFALDTKNQELFSLFKAGQEVREIRVPKTFASIAGFTALSRKTANVRDAYDPNELARFHASVRVCGRRLLGLLGCDRVRVCLLVHRPRFLTRVLVGDGGCLCFYVRIRASVRVLLFQFATLWRILTSSDGLHLLDGLARQ